MSKKTLNITQLYPREMNIYGDNGNALVLKKRAELYGFSVKLRGYEPGDPAEILRESDIILGGGGQDSGQEKVLADLQKNGKLLRELAADGVAMLMICGLYQLFGEFFRESDGTELAGIGIFDIETIAGDKRLIGNITTRTEFGDLVGYENHSGLTYLRAGQAAFGEIVCGAGNNGRDGANRKSTVTPQYSKNPPSAHNVRGSEGARANNCFGSYLHGPILPKNPVFADELLRLAAVRNFGDDFRLAAIGDAARELRELDDLANRAHLVATKRPR